MMSAHVVVYSLEGCPACRATVRALVDLDRNPAALQLVKALEFASAPVVTTGDRWWSGFRPDRIKAISKA